MADHQATAASRTAAHGGANARQIRLGDFHRSPPAAASLDEASVTQASALGPSIANAGWTTIWGGPTINPPIGSPLQTGNDESSYLPPLAGALEQTQNSASLLSNDGWKPIASLSWPGETSSAVQLSETLSRPAGRLRGNHYEASQKTADIPRSSSPYFPQRQVQFGPSALGKSPSNNTGFNETLGARGIGQAIGGNNGSRFTSETAYAPYHNIANQHNPAHPIPGSSFVPTFSNSRQRYDELTRETREAELLAAQFRQMSVEPDHDQDTFNAANRRARFTAFTQTPINSSMPAPLGTQSQPQLADFSATYTRHSLPGLPQGQNPWGGPEESGYATDALGGETVYTEGYGKHHMMTHERNASMISTAEARSSTHNNTYYLNGNTPQIGMDLSLSSRSGAASQQQGPAHILLQRDQTFSRPPYPLPYQYPPFNGIRFPVDAHYANTPMGPLIANATTGLDGHNMRSTILEEFRSNSKSNKRYELKDIHGHVCEFSGDQHGSRFIQQKLETANSDEKEIVFNEIRPNCLQLMTDVFGNYVIQKFFEHGNQVQKSILAKQMEGHVLTLSLQMYGCRVVQKALEHILVEQQAALVKELDGHVLKCVKDQNGNHVVQKAIERVPAEHIQFIIKAFQKQVHSLATHPYGCRVIQRMLEHCDEKAQAALLEELHSCTYTLVQDQYGNYVTQHVIEHGKPEDRAKIIQLVTTQLLHFSKHKFASNVVEKSIAHGTDEQRREIVKVITTPRPDGSSPLQVLMRDQYGNYVIQKLLMQLKNKDRDVLVDQIKPQLQALKKFTYGKQINAIEKLIYNSSTPPGSQSATPPPTLNAAVPPPTKNTSHARKSSAAASTSHKAAPKDHDGAPGDSKNTKGPPKADGAPL